MSPEEFEQLKLDYIDETISAADLERLREYLKSDKQSISELDQLKLFLKEFDQRQIPQVSNELDQRIDHLIKQTENKRNWFDKQRYLAIAVYTLAILSLGTLAGVFIQSSQTNALSEEMAQIRQLLFVTMTEQEASAGKRIQAISSSAKLNKLDDKVIDILLYTLNNDQNINVRLATLNVLSDYASNHRVRVGLVQSITQQKSAIIQVALLNVMIDWQEKSAIDQFHRLLENPDIDRLVIRQIESGLEKI
ncbi:MAG: hypothetical protein KDD94_12575 [Calditrichaeota bacterium]|nr:hypothetical protein [Calditrichota bacterium]